MNILIVCIQGMTSGVMANRLNDLAEEKQEEYRFKACGWSRVGDNISWADVCLITPQAKGYLDVIEPLLSKNQIRCIQVSTLDLAFNRIPYTYENIVYLVKPANKQTEMDKIKEIFLWFLFCFVLYASIHVCSQLTTVFLHNAIFYPLDCATWQCISIYFSSMVTMLMLKETNVSRVVSILMGVYIVLLSTPATFDSYGETQIFEKYMTQGFYGPKWLVYYLVITILTTYCFRIALQRDQEKNKRSKLNWLQAGIPLSLMTAVFLTLRFLIALIIR